MLGTVQSPRTLRVVLFVSPTIFTSTTLESVVFLMDQSWHRSYSFTFYIQKHHTPKMWCSSRTNHSTILPYVVTPQGPSLVPSYVSHKSPNFSGWFSGPSHAQNGIYYNYLNRIFICSPKHTSPGQDNDFVLVPVIFCYSYM